MDTVTESIREEPENAFEVPSESDPLADGEQPVVVNPTPRLMHRISTKKWDQKAERKSLNRQTILLKKSLVEIENELSETPLEPQYRFTEDGRMCLFSAFISYIQDSFLPSE